MTMTISGSGTITGLSAGGLPDSTITQAELATGVAGTGPAFSAYPSTGQSVTSGVATKILFQTTEFDTTGGMYTSSRFQPTVAGYYQVQVSIYASTGTTVTQALIYKNGSQFKRAYTTGTNAMSEVTSLVYLNGSTDYVEGYGALTGPTPSIGNLSDLTYFQAALVRAA